MNGLTALVTGGGSGIGLATARLLLEEGANVMIVGRDRDRLKKAESDLSQFGERVRYLPADISSEGYANKVVGGTIDAFGGLHVLVNNAGVFRGGSLLDMTEEDYDYNVDINLKGTWFMCRFGALAIKNSGGGAIVNVSSFLALRGVKNMPSSAYSAAKGGVVSLTRALAVELAPLNIRVNAVLPALVNTPILRAVAELDGVDRLLEQSKKWHPLGRAGEPEDVARAILFLANPENDWITGAELTVDGGRAAM